MTTILAKQIQYVENILLKQIAPYWVDALLLVSQIEESINALDADPIRKELIWKLCETRLLESPGFDKSSVTKIISDVEKREEDFCVSGVRLYSNY